MKSYAIALLGALAAAQELKDTDTRDAIEFNVDSGNGATAYIEDAWVGKLRITSDRLKGSMLNTRGSEITLPEVFVDGDIVQAYLCLDTACTVWEYNVAFAHIHYCTKPAAGFNVDVIAARATLLNQGVGCVKQSTYSEFRGVGEVVNTAECTAKLTASGSDKNTLC